MKKLIAPTFALLSIAVALAVYDSLPDQIASHWNTAGEVDGYMSKFWGTALMPIVIVVMAALFHFIPRIDPLKKNLEKFRGYFDGFVFLILLFMLMLQLQVMGWSLGYQVDPMYPVMGGIAVLFFYVGVMLLKSKRNWFVGIKTPWTLSNDKVWDKTNRLGGYLFMISAVIAFVGLMLWPCLMIWFLLVPVFATVLITLVYSYVIYKK